MLNLWQTSTFWIAAAKKLLQLRRLKEQSNHLHLFLQHCPTSVAPNRWRWEGFVSVLTAAMRMPPTPLLSCPERRGDDEPGRRRRPRGFSLAGQSSSVNSKKRPSPILDHHGTQNSPLRWSAQHKVCCDLPSLCTTHVIIIKMID